MIAKRADALPEWDEKRAEQTGYTAGNRVWHEPSGFAYKAKAGFTNIGFPPDSDSLNWEIDWEYAMPWREGTRYKIGARVYYNNGRNTYVYVASPRYFGGGSPPNEEEDNDGIRTWELDIKYNVSTSNFNGQFYLVSKSEFLFPVKTVAGWTPTKKHSRNRLDPEEWHSGNLAPDNGSGTYASLGMKDFSEFYKNLDDEIGADDYSKINSVYQSHPYDTKCYSFVELKPNDDGEYEHVREGTHMAYYRKRLRGNPQEGLYSNAVSQVAYIYDWNDPYIDKTVYYNAHGFSIEMWPTANANEFVLVPSAGLGQHAKAGNLRTSTSPIPNGGPFAGTYGGNKTVGGGTFGLGGQCHGQLVASDGVEQLPASPPSDSELKSEGGYWTHTPAFSNKSVVLYMLKIDNLISFKPVTYTYPETGETVVLYYDFDLQNPTATFLKERIDSFEDSYKTETGEIPPFYDGSTFLTRTIAQGNAFNFNKFKIVNTFSGWQVIGWSEG